MTGELDVKGLPPVRMEGMMAQNEYESRGDQCGAVCERPVQQGYGNALEQPVVTGLQLKVEAIPETDDGGAGVGAAEHDEARAGETMEVEATLHPYQAEARVVRVKVKLPDDADAGPMRVVVSDGATVDRLTTPDGNCAACGGAGGCGGADEPDACERSGVCDAAGPCGAGGAGWRGAAGGAAVDGECAGAAEGGAEDAVDGRERGGGGSAETDMR